jgi:hypothetical protein
MKTIPEALERYHKAVSQQLCYGGDDAEVIAGLNNDVREAATLVASMHTGLKDMNLILCLERITLALQGIELALEKHNTIAGRDKDNSKIDEALAAVEELSR